MKRYQVFISSTYTDLIEERKAVEQVILRNGHFPVGMEAFPAADEEQFTFIKTIIDQCDYYVLILAGRYGSLAPDGVGYTEKEFDYALQQKIPILFLLREGVEALPANQVEATEEGRERLRAFVLKASKGRIRKPWNTIDGLKLAVYEALNNAIATKPRLGWVRGSGDSLEELVRENLELKRQLAEASKETSISRSTKAINWEREFEISATATSSVTMLDFVGDSQRDRAATYSKKLTLKAIFLQAGPLLLTAAYENSVKSKVGEAIVPKQVLDQSKHFISVEQRSFDALKLELVSCNLVDIETEKNDRGLVPVWELSPIGRQCLIDLSMNDNP